MKYCLLRFPYFKDKAVTLSYDDAVQSDIKLLEILDKYNLKCTFNVNTGKFAKDDNEIRLTKEKVLKLYDVNKHEIALHGEKHLSLAEIDSSIAVKEIIVDKTNLEEDFGRIISGMAIANNSTSPEIESLLKMCKIDYARTSISSENFDLPTDLLNIHPTSHHKNPKLMELVDEFLDFKQPYYMWQRAPKWFLLWGHSYEFDNNKNWDIIENFAKKISNRNDVWYVTTGELVSYIKAFKSLKFSSDGSMIYNPTATDVYLNYYGIDVMVKSGEFLKNLKSILDD